MIGLDGAGEAATCVSSAGGVKVSVKLGVETESCDAAAYRLEVGGLQAVIPA
jgi:hypothetical protein